MILDETRERFIKAIVAKVDPARIAEIHFFAPIKQGGVESGVAVIAVAPHAVPAAPPQIVDAAETAQAPVDEAQPEGGESVDAVESAETVEDAEDADSAEAAASTHDAESGEDAVSVEGAEDAESGEDAESAEDPESAVSEDLAGTGAVRHPEATAQRAAAEGPLDAEEESPYADSAEDSASAHRGPSEASPPQDDAPAAPIERHVIYTARYRLTLKGPDRGKWETNITAEADAPIITVDAVVRGVQRRAGDVDDPTRMSGDEIRASVPAARPEQPAHAR